MKEKIEEILNGIERGGVDRLARYLLHDSDFLTAPASIYHHLACPGGLAEHTFNVINCAIDLNEKHGQLFTIDSVIIAGLVHDLCKVNFYVEADEAPSEKQVNYLKSLTKNAGFIVPDNLNKSYASTLIDFLLNKYKLGMTLPEYVHNYKIDDQFPVGHGEKSLYIASQYLELTVDEALAIRWHMGAWEFNWNSTQERQAYNKAVELSKLVSILHLADMEATHLVEA